MFEKVSPAHPDKVADRIAGALVDIAYAQKDDPRIAVEVLLGHGHCHIIAETSVPLPEEAVAEAVNRIAGPGLALDFHEVPQDPKLAENQSCGIRCGDNGIFCGAPLTDEQRELARIAGALFAEHPSDGKCLVDDGRLVICWSHADTEELKRQWPNADVNPLGDWEGGPDVDSGATNRKLGSDMGGGATGGGLHGKDLSKADVTVNIWAHLMAQLEDAPVELSCAIGDEKVGGVPFAEMVEVARDYVTGLGGFEALAEWGLIRPL